MATSEVGSTAYAPLPRDQAASPSCTGAVPRRQLVPAPDASLLAASSSVFQPPRNDASS